MQALVSAAKVAAVLVPDRERETLRVRGSDAKSWLNGLISCDLSSLSPGRGAYGLLLSKQGKIQSDLDILEGKTGDLLIGVASGHAERVMSLLDSHLVMEDAEVSQAPNLGWLRCVGPRSWDAALHVPDAEARGELDWLGFGGAAAVVSLERLDDAAASAAQAAGSSGAVADLEGWHALRVASGFPAFGRDYTGEDNPHEASLDRRAVSFSKGCYLGQEVVYMQDARGKVKRRVVLIALESAALLAPGTPVIQRKTGVSVGSVTSAVIDGGRTLALARLQAPFYEADSDLAILGQSVHFVPPLV